MERISVLAAVCFFAACGGDTNCDFGKFSGTYTVHFDEQPNGSCGALPDENIIVEQGTSPESSGCTTTYENKDAAACTSDVDATCDLSGDDLREHEVIHTDDAADGSEASGTVTLTASRISTGETVCVSTYKIKYTRQ